MVKLKVLVADDETSIREMLAEFLRGSFQNIEVHEVEDLDTAKSILSEHHKQGSPFHLVVT